MLDKDTLELVNKLQNTLTRHLAKFEKLIRQAEKEGKTDQAKLLREAMNRAKEGKFDIHTDLEILISQLK